jgi:hypothetical protein
MGSWTGSALRMQIRIQKGENVSPEDQKKIIKIIFFMQSYFRQRPCLKLFYVRKIRWKKLVWFTFWQLGSYFTRIRIRNGSGSVYNQCGSEELVCTVSFFLIIIIKMNKNLLKELIFSTFYSPLDPGSGFQLRIRIHPSHWIRIQSGYESTTLLFLNNFLQYRYCSGI